MKQEGFIAGNIVYDWANRTGLRGDGVGGVHRLDDKLQTPQQLLDAFTWLHIFDFKAQNYSYGLG